MRKLVVLFAFMTTIGSVAIAPPASAEAGALDHSFGGDGRVTTEGPVESRASDVLVDDDGNLVAIGIGYASDAFGNAIDAQVVRYLPNGEPDLAFDGDGIVGFGVGDRTVANAGVIQPDGKILVAGGSVVGGKWALMVARLDAEGVPDPTFDGDGFFRGADGSLVANGIALGSDGRIVVVGEDHKDFGVMALQSDGSPDPTFSTDGEATVDISRADVPSDVAVQGNDRIIVGGGSLAPYASLSAARFMPDGSLDTSFSADGTLLIRKTVGAAEGIALQSDGKIILAGPDYTRSPSDFGVLRLRRNGTLDPTFSDDGRTRIGASGGAEEAATDVLVQPNGKIVVAGTGNTSSHPTSEFLTARLGSSGHLDLTFGKKGWARTDFGEGTYGSAESIVRQTDGKIVVAGTAIGAAVSFGLVRYLGQ